MTVIDQTPGMHDEVAWERPGPGTWQLDADHNAAVTSRIVMDVFAHGFNGGFRTAFARYGLPLSHVEIGYVNRRAYMCPKPFGAPDKDGGPPPPIVLKALSRLVPKMRRRFAVAAEALAEQRWLRDAERWERERDGWIQRLDALSVVDPAALDDEDLADHLETTYGLGRDAIHTHFELIGPGLGVGLFLAGAAGHGIRPAEAVAVLEGASPASGAEAVASLWRVHDAVVAAGGDPATLTSYADIRAASADAAAELDRHLRRYGIHLLGDDIDQPLVVDQERWLVRCVAAPPPPTDADAGLRWLDDLVASVPESARAQLRQLALDARRCYASLDDNSNILATWAMGVLGRACRVAGERLESSGRIPSRDSVVDLGIDELVALVRGAGGPGLDELQRRADERSRLAAATAPPVLGPPPAEPPTGVFPAAVETLTEAMGLYIETKFTPRDAGPGPTPGRSGVGIGTATVRGRAVVTTDVDDALARIEPGDVLVTTLTNPAYNTVLGLVGGLVTETGGPLSHPAVVARELGIPAVLSVAGACDAIPDGATVEVDAAAGTVRVI